MTDLRSLFGMAAIEEDAVLDKALSQDLGVEEVWLSVDNAEDRPMMLRVVLQSVFSDAGLNVDDHIAVPLDSLNGETPYQSAFQSPDGLTMAIRELLKHHRLTL